MSRLRGVSDVEIDRILIFENELQRIYQGTRGSRGGRRAGHLQADESTKRADFCIRGKSICHSIGAGLRHEANKYPRLRIPTNSPSSGPNLNAMTSAIQQTAFAEDSLIPLTTEHFELARSTWGKESHCRNGCLPRDDDEIDLALPLAPDQRLTGYVAMKGDLVQAIVEFDDKLRPSKKGKGASALHVRYLGTAPWIRARYENIDHKRRAVGVMLAQLVRNSVQLGAEGRIGLHSTADMEPVYEEHGFDNLGRNPSHGGMTYFEIRPFAALGLLSKPEYVLRTTAKVEVTSVAARKVSAVGF
jgi:hypothetical protein